MKAELFLKFVYILCLLLPASINGNNTPMLSLNYKRVWEKNITGEGVIIAVVDDGVNFDHLDLKDNHEPNADLNLLESVPTDYRSYSHGTKCAGVIAGKWNGMCGNGIAYDAKIGGIRLFQSTRSNDTLEAKAFKHQMNLIDIYSNSWGPKDGGFTIGGPGKKARKALKTTATKGRNGKGGIFVFSSGNGGAFRDSCAFDGFVNSIYTIGIGVVGRNGKALSFSERCGAIMASAFGEHNTNTSSSERNDACVTNFGGTSAASAMAAGVIALALQQNSELTRRDVHHLIVRTSSLEKLTLKVPKKVNAAGLEVHESVGFGLINAEKMVEVAKKWKTVPPQIKCTIDLEQNMTIPFTVENIYFSVDTSKNSACSKIKYIEVVKVKLSLRFKPRAMVAMDLTSPSNTTSRFLYVRPFDALTQKSYYNDLVVTSVHYWGENPNGNWTVSLGNTRLWFRQKGTLRKFRLVLYGTEENPLQENARHLSSVMAMEWCGETRYNTNDKICCADESIVEKNAKCDGRSYNKCTQLCCNNTIFESKGQSVNVSKSGGSISYWKYTCSAGRLKKVSDGVQYFCGEKKNIYDPRLQQCCKDKTVVNKAWCGERQLDSCNEICCNGRKYKKIYKTKTPWNYAFKVETYTTECDRQGVNYRFNRMYVCGEKPFNRNFHTCCSAKGTNRDRESCILDNRRCSLISNRLYVCWKIKWCGYKRYNTLTQRCCKYWWGSRVRDSTARC